MFVSIVESVPQALQEICQLTVPEWAPPPPGSQTHLWGSQCLDVVQPGGSPPLFPHWSSPFPGGCRRFSESSWTSPPRKSRRPAHEPDEPGQNAHWASRSMRCMRRREFLTHSTRSPRVMHSSLNKLVRQQNTRWYQQKRANTFLGTDVHRMCMRKTTTTHRYCI